jgi:hypothetical protein
MDKDFLNKEILVKDFLNKDFLNKDFLNKDFLDSLNEKEIIAYHIAKSHLGTMFSLDKCNAFLEWVKTEKKDI